MLAAAVAMWAGVLTVAYETVPDHNTDQSRFDTVIVLGTPARADGSPSPEMRERVEEGVREYRAGVAPHLIMTGGPAHNRYVEAHTMAQLAEGEGVPEQAIVEEGQAQDTIQNIWYSHLILEREGWHSALVVSSPYHLPRTALILREYTGASDFKWRTDGAHWPPELPVWQRAEKVYREAEVCLKIRLHGFASRRFFPAGSSH